MNYSEQEIRNLILRAIRDAEVPGTYSGGSGHLSDKGIKLDHFEIRKGNERNIRINCFYTVEIISEFGAYPENPGYRYRYKRSIMLGPAGDVNSVSDRSSYSLSDLPKATAWAIVREEINHKLGLRLARIEWEYGDNRAPVEFPPIYEMIPGSNGNVYRCILEEEPGRELARLEVTGHPADLIPELSSLFTSLFGWADIFREDDNM